MSNGAILNERRRARARGELEQLRHEVAVWLQRRAAAASALAAAIDDVKVSLAPGEFAEACALHELRILWLRRVWQFFRTRLDQRDDPEWRSLLKAADEVVWSMYRVNPLNVARAGWGLVFAPGTPTGVGKALARLIERGLRIQRPPEPSRGDVLGDTSPE